MRLFSALWPAPEVVEHLAQALAAVPLPPGVRRTPAQHWHLTLAFYGDDADLARRQAELDRLAALAAPTLRLAGAGTFAGVLWVGVQPADGALRELAAAADADPRHPHRPHVTVARWRRSRPPVAVPAGLADYCGPAWTPRRAVLVHSHGGTYRWVHSVALRAW